MRNLIMVGLATALMGCATAPQPQARSAEAQAKLQQLLAGKTAGSSMMCLPAWRRDKMVIIDNDTILFDEGSTVYRNELQGNCTNLSSGFYTLVTRSPTGSLCRGEIADVVDIHTNMTVGSCALGDFVPYTGT